MDVSHLGLEYFSGKQKGWSFCGQRTQEVTRSAFEGRLQRVASLWCSFKNTTAKEVPPGATTQMSGRRWLQQSCNRCCNRPVADVTKL